MSTRGETFVPGLSLGSGERSERPIIIAVRGTDVVLATTGEGGVRLTDAGDLGDLGVAPTYIGKLGDRPCYGAMLHDSTEQLGVGLAIRPARQLLALLDAGSLMAIGQAIAVVEWDVMHRYCGRCGVETSGVERERARRCPRCLAVFYPRIAPAIAVLVSRDDEILLARNAQFPPGRFSAIAGFVEIGESLESAVRRELREEVGVEVTNVRYFDSQPWPLGRSLMVAYHADYAGGDVRPDGVEIVEAGWYTTDRLPDLPPPVSISRRLIDSFTTSRGGRAGGSLGG